MSRPDQSRPLKLLCIPPAGAGAAVYRAWARKLPAWIEVVSADLPGRDGRFRAKAFRDLRESAAFLSRQVASLGPRWAVFGYSMGALLAYEIVRSGVARTGPLHLFVAACRPPHDVGSNPRLHDLSSSDLRETLGRIGTNSVLSSTDLFDAVEETLRADLQAVETYTLTQSPPLSASLTALCGAADPLAPPDAVSGWSDYTAERFVRHVYPGDHFFIEHNEEAVVSLVESTCRMFP